jgi:hypothetical protein
MLPSPSVARINYRKIQLIPQINAGAPSSWYAQSKNVKTKVCFIEVPAKQASGAREIKQSENILSNR